MLLKDKTSNSTLVFVNRAEVLAPGSFYQNERDIFALLLFLLNLKQDK
jgi:hypothetical protein